jgi:hypothetical protein
METTIDKQRKSLLKRFHTLLGKCGVSNDDKAVILGQYGVTSSRDLNVHELIEVCNALDYQANPELAESDRLRKRLIAAVGAWMKAMNIDGNIDTIKAIACRAAGQRSFNAIPVERLRSLCFAFNNKRKDIAFVDVVTAEIVEQLKISN